LNREPSTINCRRDSGGLESRGRRSRSIGAKIAIQIHPNDNVVTLVDAASSGSVVQYVTSAGRQEITVVDEVPFGHKIAVDDVPAGQSVVKYDEVIGRASRAIRRGEHVHAHNVESTVQGGAK